MKVCCPLSQTIAPVHSQIKGDLVSSQPQEKRAMSACLFFPPLIVFEIPFFAGLLVQLGYSLVSGMSKTKNIGNTAVKAEACDLVFQTRGGVEVGIQQQEDGSIKLVCDEEELQKVEGVSKIEMHQELTKEYTHKKISEELAKQGFSIVEEERLADQTIKIRVRRWV
jgi:hypothetical protein